MIEPKPPYGFPPKDVLKYVEETKQKVFHVLVLDEHFNDFIEAVDKVGQGGLIETLFGSEEAYIDTPGNYHEDQTEGYEGSPIDHYINNCGEGGGQPHQVLAMYAWYIGNLYKVHAWMTALSKEQRTDSK